MAPQAFLVVDDEGPVRQLLARYLLKHAPDAKVTGVGTIAEGQTALETCDFSLILTDANLKFGITYKDIVRLLHARRHRCPVVVVSGACDDQLRRDALANGATAVLSKDTLLTGELWAIVAPLFAHPADADGSTPLT